MSFTQQRGEVGFFELGDGAGLGGLKIAECNPAGAALGLAAIVYRFELIETKADQRIIGHQELSVDEVLEFAHIARPAIT